MSETIGKQLRAAREARHLSIEDVAHKTRIHRDLLCQLEAGDYSKFPNLMFLKSFLKLYSEHVGFDASEEIARLNAERNRHGEQYLLGGLDPQLRESYGRLTSRIPVRPILAYVAAVALLVIGGSYLVSHLYANSGFNETTDTRTPEPETSETNGAESQAEIQTPAIAISDSELANEIGTKEISEPPPAVPKAIPSIPLSPLEPDEFEIGAKEIIDPDDIPRAAPIIREEDEPSDSLQSDEAAVGSEIPSNQTEADVDIWSVEE